jgi:tetratricopeptide (TPR) repeat protein
MVTQDCLGCGQTFDARMESCPHCGGKDGGAMAGGAEVLEVMQAKSESVKLSNEGARLFQSGRVNDAQAMFRKAIEVNPMHERAYSNLGYLLIQTGNTVEAIQVLEKLLGFNPRWDDARRYLATARASAARPGSEGGHQRPSKSVGFFKRLVALLPNASDAGKGEKTQESKRADGTGGAIRGSLPGLPFDDLTHVVIYTSANVESFSPSDEMERVFEDMIGRSVSEISRKARFQVFRNSGETVDLAKNGHGSVGLIAATELGMKLRNQDLPKRFIDGKLKATVRYLRESSTGREFAIVALYDWG